jgi:HD-like signal output (HDOD) protein
MALAGQSEKVVNLPWAHLRLPPFPQVAIRVLQLANNENVQLNQLCELISSDPAFASEVLTVANSVLYSPRYPSNSIHAGDCRAGREYASGHVHYGWGEGLSWQVDESSGDAGNCGATIWHAASLPNGLHRSGLLDKDTAYTAGIMHDIGRIALAVIQPKEYANLLGTHRGTPESILEGERHLFGWDHSETGRQLIADWKLPRSSTPL